MHPCFKPNWLSHIIFLTLYTIASTCRSPQNNLHTEYSLAELSRSTYLLSVISEKWKLQLKKKLWFKSSIFCVLIPCILMKSNQCFKGSYPLVLQSSLVIFDLPFLFPHKLQTVNYIISLSMSMSLSMSSSVFEPISSSHSCVVPSSINSDAQWIVFLWVYSLLTVLEYLLYTCKRRGCIYMSCVLCDGN
jgi:hypothetical protein